MKTPKPSLKRPIAFDEPSEATLEDFPDWAKSLHQVYLDTNQPKEALKSAYFEIKDALFRCTYAYIAEGKYLECVQENNLFRFDYTGSFRQWCQDVYPKGYYYALNIIRAAKIGWNLLCKGFKEVPTNVSQCLELEKTFKKDSSGKPDIAFSWDMVKGYAECAGKKITVGLIKFLVNPNEKEEKMKVPLSKKKWQQFERWAKAQGVNPQDLIEQFMGDCIGDGEPEKTDPDMEPDTGENPEEIVETVDKEKEQKWLSDVQALLDEHSAKNDNDNYNTT